MTFKEPVSDPAGGLLGAHKKRSEFTFIPFQRLVNDPEKWFPIFRKGPLEVDVVGVMVTGKDGAASDVFDEPTCFP